MNKVADLKIGDETLSYGKITKIARGKPGTDNEGLVKLWFDSNASAVFSPTDKLMLV